MDVKLQAQVGDPEVVRENFNKIRDAFKDVPIATDATWGGIIGSLSSQTDLQSALDAKEAIITAGSTSQYLRGDKTWQDFNSTVLSATLAGISIAGGSVTSSDNVLTAFGKLQNQINGVLGGAVYKGVWNASTNTPSLASGTGTKGYYYVVSVNGATNLDGITDWKVGDWAIFNGTTWDKVDNTDAVSSVNGAIGAISLAGTANRISVSGTTFDIASTYAGQTSITTLGTIATGVWNGTAVGSTYGGTGLTSYAKGDVLIATGTNTVGVVNAPTTDGYVFTYDLASGLPMWKAGSGGGGGTAQVYLGNAINGGGASAYSATIAEVTALVAGQIFILKFLHAATSTAATLNINGYGVKSIFKNGTTVTNGIDFGGENQYSILQYDGSNFQLVGNNMANIAYLNGFQTFTSQNTFNGNLHFGNTFASSPNDYRANLYVYPQNTATALSASVISNLGISAASARILLGGGDVSNNIPSSTDSIGILITHKTPSWPSGNHPNISTLFVTKPIGTPFGTNSVSQVAYFDDAPTAGTVNNWSINAGKSTFRSTVILSASPGTAGSTPLKLTAGTLVSTPEAGAFEYDGTHLYFTTGTTRNIII